MISTHLATLLLAVAGTGAGNNTVLLDFYADWCGPCQQMEPVVSQLIAAGAPIRRVNVNQNRELAARYNVQSIPCYVLVINGQEADRLVGATSAGELEALLSKARLEKTASHTSLAPSTGQSSDPLASTASALNSGANPAAAGGLAGLSGVPTPPVPHGPPAALSAAKLLEASVRLTIEDRDGFSYGSGTIIDARQGEALVLTCGHIFRDSQGKGTILIDVFGPQGAQKLKGRLVSYDIKRDVGLISFTPGVPVTVAPIAPQARKLLPGDRVISIGCDHGAPPTARESKVTSLNKFSGPANVEIAGQPVQGRSGGGLFDAEGYVVGVCNAADPTDNEGLFAAAATLYEELDHAHLSTIYQSPAAGLLGAGGSGGRGDVRTLPAALSADELRQAATMVDLSAAGRTALGQLNNVSQQAQVICIVRPLADPKAKPEVVILDRASAAFLQQLATEQMNSSRQLTSMETRRAAGPACSLGSSAAGSVVR